MQIYKQILVNLLTLHISTHKQKPKSTNEQSEFANQVPTDEREMGKWLYHHMERKSDEWKGGVYSR